ncbi:low-density lipoprotein receptor class A domain-containing protein 1 isoform X1 [Peromyscus eremicus]|uniref:low-density lipoprotein receptor class A domain-containing protein 1 isoform X1 n=1 Tax=Peromyscus eremicus TaxID=42410 RepID=UPI0027DBB311|nr:low-density lipoprotein receptor class A domain-containing protein 1 isoform X1 [Peromyscus eremicus]
MSLGCEGPAVCPVCFWSLGQGDSESQAAAGKRARPGGEGCGPCCCSRRGFCLSAFLLLLLAVLAALLVVATVLGRPPRVPETQSCVTMTNRTGFLCHDRRHCIPAHGVCDGIRTCAHGEDEEESLCRDVPLSLPSFLLAHCGDPASWIYSDQKCDGTNNCGDCSDELSPVTVCPPCGPGWWRCTPTVFRYCSCIPRVLCRDHVQHCSDWSDEYVCPGP